MVNYDRSEGEEIALIPVPVLLKAYRNGLFPMAHDDGELYWHDPDPRAIFPLEELVPDERTARHLRSPEIRITIDSAFRSVIEACSDRSETWIDPRIIASYIELHRAGYAHSLEVWRNDELVGGIYGVSIGGAFFGESMFNRKNNMGKVAFHALAAHLRRNGFTLFDTQYLNPFTEKLGAIEISRSRYLKLLAQAVERHVEFRSGTAI